MAASSGVASRILGRRQRQAHAKLALLARECAKFLSAPWVSQKLEALKRRVKLPQLRIAPETNPSISETEPALRVEDRQRMRLIEFPIDLERRNRSTSPPAAHASLTR